MILFATNSNLSIRIIIIAMQVLKLKEKKIDRLTEALTKGVIKILRVEKKYVIIISKDIIEIRIFLVLLDFDNSSKYGIRE